jgi:hypothetical protein
MGSGGEYGSGQGCEGPYLETGRDDRCSYEIEEGLVAGSGSSSNVATSSERPLVTRECLKSE